MKFNEELKVLRKQFELTQQNLADILHVSHQAVSNWEKGKTYPDLDILKDLSTIYGISVDEMLNPQKTPKLPTVEDLEVEYHKKKKKLEWEVKNVKPMNTPSAILYHMSKDELEHIDEKYAKKINAIKQKQRMLKERANRQHN